MSDSGGSSEAALCYYHGFMCGGRRQRGGRGAETPYTMLPTVKICLTESPC